MAFFEAKSVLVTGGAGLVGSNLIPRLLEAGAIIRSTFHQREPTRHPRVEYVHADLRRAEDCARIVSGIDYLFHCAARTPGAQATAEEPLRYTTDNLVIDAQVLSAAYRAGVKKFLWLSSATAGYPPSDHPVREDEFFSGEPYEKYFAVGWSKRITEILCRMYGTKLARPMCIIVLRPSYIYGPHDDFEWATAHVIPALIRKVVERQNPVEVWGTGEDIRDPIYVDDVVRAMCLAMEKVDDYDVFNVALGRGYSVKDMLDFILKLDGYSGAKVVFNSSKPSMIPVRLVDASKAERVLGFRPAVDMREGLARTIAWYRSARGLTQSPAA